jgi:hypothetical protein
MRLRYLKVLHPNMCRMFQRHIFRNDTTASRGNLINFHLLGGTILQAVAIDVHAQHEDNCHSTITMTLLIKCKLMTAFTKSIPITAGNFSMIIQEGASLYVSMRASDLFLLRLGSIFHRTTRTPLNSLRNTCSLALQNKTMSVHVLSLKERPHPSKRASLRRKTINLAENNQ